MTRARPHEEPGASRLAVQATWASLAISLALAFVARCR